MKIDYKNSKLVNLAMTHPSYSNEYGLKFTNQRLEFLGDAILDLIIGEYLYNTYDGNEGDLTQLRAAIVKKDTLSKFAKKININHKLKLGKSENSLNDSILADAFEALIAAIYIENGYDYAVEFIFTNFKTDIEKIIKSKPSDYKSMFQEKMHKKGMLNIEYRLDKEVGKDHDKTFYISLIVDGKLMSKAYGKSKKKAEIMCAKKALENEN